MSATGRLVYFFGETPLCGAGDAGDAGEAGGARDMGEARELLGGKGLGLSEMTRAGLPVPPGFTITAGCCECFLESGGEWPPGLEDEVRTNLARLEEETGRAFGRGADPLLVSVRSGAAVSMPGMMDTILNCGIGPALARDVGDGPRFWEACCQFITMFAKTVAGVAPDELAPGAKGSARPHSREVARAMLERYEVVTGSAFPTRPWDMLVQCIDAVFRSWETDRAVAYRKRHGIRGLRGTAVTVQAMFPSEVSGVLFTHDPNDLDSGNMIVESSYGLGESVVSGEVTPDRLVVRRDDLSLVRSVIGEKGGVVRVSVRAGEGVSEGDAERDPSAPSLGDEELRELCRTAMKVEAHFGCPSDIEWGFADGRLALLQSRPIRGLEVARDVEVGRLEEIERLRGLARGKRRVWVAHNLGETLRAPTPLTWDVVRRFMTGAGGFGLMYRDFGYRPSREVRARGFLELIAGRIYADPERAAQLFWDGMPLAYDLDELARDGSVLDRAPARLDPDRADGRFLLKLPGTVVAMVRSARRLRRLGARAKERFEKEVLPPYLDYVREKRGQDLRALSTRGVLAELDERRGRVLDDFGKESLKPGFFGGMALDALRSRLAQLAGEAKGTELATAAATAIEGDVTFEQDAMLHSVAAGDASMDDFLEEYGHRAVGEMELAEARWREDSLYVERIVERIVERLRGRKGRSPEEAREENARRRREAEEEIFASLPSWGGTSFREELEENLRDARSLLPYRETGKHYLMTGYELVRLAVVELSRRWELGDDVFFLRLEELGRFEAERDTLCEEIARRKVRWGSARRLDMPDVIDSDDLDRLGLPRELEHGDVLRGEAVAAGVATGRARIVFDPRDARGAAGAGDTDEGCVLVCPSTDPGWTPLFLEARALVVERGGVLSHGAIVARDFGIPAVVCADATRRIADGARVRVDGNRGVVTMLDDAGQGTTGPG